MFYLYVIQNQDDEIYVGYSSNLKQRIGEHEKGKVVSTKGHIWSLVYYEAYLAEFDARNRERQLKSRGQAKRWLKHRIKGSLEGLSARSKSL